MLKDFIRKLLCSIGLHSYKWGDIETIYYDKHYNPSVESIRTTIKVSEDSILGVCEYCQYKKRELV